MACSASAPPARAAAAALLLLASIACCCLAAPPGALVTRLPGFDGAQLPSKHYAGYATVNETVGSRLYYYLVESERDPARDPVVLWLNGGPGCSSLDGFVYEHGASSTLFSDPVCYCVIFFPQPCIDHC
jgi:serine carboxypeptidase-like clade 1